MSIVTKKGDNGSTRLLYDVQVSKADCRINAIGEVDETSAAIGVLKSHITSNWECHTTLTTIQKKLITIMGELACPVAKKAEFVPKFGELLQEDLSFLELHLKEIEASLPPQRDWVLYGESVVGATAYLASKVCRRAERAIIGASQEESVRALILQYINRLSDYLFLLGRHHDENEN